MEKEEKGRILSTDIAEIGDGAIEKGFIRQPLAVETQVASPAGRSGPIIVAVEAGTVAVITLQ